MPEYKIRREICSELTFSLAAIFCKDSDALTPKLNPFLNVREGVVELKSEYGNEHM